MSKMIKTGRIYDVVNGLTPYKTPHNISYQTTGTGDMGYIYAPYWEMVVPGDKLELNAELIVRFQPQLAPLMHQIDGHVRWFYVPNRILWDGDKWYNNWETYITGAVEGTEITKWNQQNPTRKVTPPDIAELGWNPQKYIDEWGAITTDPSGFKGAKIGTLWENMGLPIDTQLKQEPTSTNNMPNDLPKRAYNKIYNDWFRDENLQAPVHLQCDNLRKCNWDRDYFVSAGYEQQKGEAPNIGVGILKHIVKNQPSGIPIDSQSGTTKIIGTNSSRIDGVTTTTTVTGSINIEDHEARSITVSDLRTLTAIQKALELDMRGGTRYIEFLKANFNVAPRDERLQLAEYIGQEKFQINISEVLTTANTSDGKTGDMQGHAIGMKPMGQQNHKYYAQEYGVVIGTICIIPKPQYQQGIPRQLWYKDKWEWYRPQLAYLSEQEIRNREIYYNGIQALPTDDTGIFGFQGRWDEMRIRENMVTGLMRADAPSNLSFWNLARHFTNRPKLNSEFIECNPRKDFLQVPTEPAMIMTIGWRALAERPIPATSDPGLLDHVYGEGSQSNKIKRAGRRF